MERRFHTVRAVLALACAAVLAGACATDEPLGLEDTLEPSFSQGMARARARVTTSSTTTDVNP